MGWNQYYKGTQITKLVQSFAWLEDLLKLSDFLTYAFMTVAYYNLLIPVIDYFEDSWLPNSWFQSGGLT